MPALTLAHDAVLAVVELLPEGMPASAVLVGRRAEPVSSNRRRGVGRNAGTSTPSLLGTPSTGAPRVVTPARRFRRLSKPRTSGDTTSCLSV
jgi:hypothetical protein